MSCNTVSMHTTRSKDVLSLYLDILCIVFTNSAHFPEVDEWNADPFDWWFLYLVHAPDLFPFLQPSMVHGRYWAIELCCWQFDVSHSSWWTCARVHLPRQRVIAKLDGSRLCFAGFRSLSAGGKYSHTICTLSINWLRMKRILNVVFSN